MRQRRTGSVLLLLLVLVVVYRIVATLALDTIQTRTSRGCGGVRIRLGEVVRGTRVGRGGCRRVLVLVELRCRGDGGCVGQLRRRKWYQTTWRRSRKVGRLVHIARWYPAKRK